jgi:hypothetical protein
MLMVQLKEMERALVHQRETELCSGCRMVTRSDLLKAMHSHQPMASCSSKELVSDLFPRVQAMLAIEQRQLEEELRPNASNPDALSPHRPSGVIAGTTCCVGFATDSPRTRRPDTVRGS